jgi:hypothetical protein
MLIVQMTSFITRYILNMFITNNSLHIKKLQPCTNLYPIYELKVSIGLLFLTTTFCHPKILKPSLIINKTN